MKLWLPIWSYVRQLSLWKLHVDIITLNDFFKKQRWNRFILVFNFLYQHVISSLYSNTHNTFQLKSHKKFALLFSLFIFMLEHEAIQPHIYLLSLLPIAQIPIMPVAETNLPRSGGKLYRLQSLAVHEHEMMSWGFRSKRKLSHSRNFLFCRRSSFRCRCSLSFMQFRLEGWSQSMTPFIDWKLQGTRRN